MGILLMSGARGESAVPAAPTRPATDEYHGVKVVDRYRWLENWEDPAVRAWSAGQNARTRAYFDHLLDRPGIKARLRELIASTSPSYFDLQFRGGRLFAMKDQPPKQQPLLVVLNASADPGSEKVVYDPNTASASGSIAVTFYVPSFDGKRVALAVSENGSEDSAGTVLDTETGVQLSDRVPRVNFATAGGSLDWKADGSGFFYTRYPQGNERPPEDANFFQQIYFHKLGEDASKDTYILGHDFPRIAEIELRTSDDGHWLVATVANGDGGEFAHYVMDETGKWTQLTHFADHIITAKPGPDGNLYLLSRDNAPRGKIQRLPLSDLQLDHAQLVVTERRGTESQAGDAASIDNIILAPNRLYIVYLRGGPEVLRVFDLSGKPLPTPPQPSIAALHQVVSVGNDILFNLSTYLEPAAWYRYSPDTGASTRTALFETSPVHFDDAEVVREFATSKDGTHVPINIIRRKGTVLDGKNPTLLSGYGGYSISLIPDFAGPFARLWLDAGGVYAIANLRGGGEYGEAWHKAGNLTRKQNVFDDFAACARYLIDQHYTSPAHLAILGGSNGGLLMGAALTQHPELYRAVVAQVGIYDMLRVELDPNGAFNTTEFGTVKDADQFRALYAYSPYHQVKDGTPYPAILFTTGENDHRVNPMQSRKMTARLQAASSSPYPIFLRTSATAGHGFGTALDEEIDEGADVLSFLFDQLGIRYAAPSK
jgi:prolyl oligopeptidase